MHAALATIRRGYTRHSLVALALMFGVYTAIGLHWWQLMDWSQGMDWLLGAIWVFMTALLCWDIDTARDLPLVAVAFLGGLVIEAWGTQTNLWHYFTAERPPAWILPAWPVAALTNARLARWLDGLLPQRGMDTAWRVVMPAFVAWMTWFAWPTIGMGTTQLVVALMVVVLMTPGDRREELVLFIAGASLGLFLEYWGTSRRCWTYYTEQVPPPVAVFAHGFASVAFHRGLQLARRTVSLARVAR